MKDQSLLLNNSVLSMESIRNNQILHDDVLAHAQEEKTDDAITNMLKQTAIKLESPWLELYPS